MKDWLLVLAAGVSIYVIGSFALAIMGFFGAIFMAKAWPWAKKPKHLTSSEWQFFQAWSVFGVALIAFILWAAFR